MKISEYPEIQEITDENTLLLVDSPSGGTQTIKASNFVGKEEDEIIADPIWIEHRNTYRGKNLGSEFTTEQKLAISSGTFDDLYVGDYWENEDAIWRIADINYWLRSGYDNNVNQMCIINHLAIVPDNTLYKAQMMSSGNTSKGYLGTIVYSSGLNTALNTAKKIFGNNILNHKELFTSSASNGYAITSAWVDNEICLMNENMVFGSKILSPAANGVNHYFDNNNTIDYTQLSLFRLMPAMILNSNYNESLFYWLRDITTSENFSAVYCKTPNGNNRADNNFGIRPVFGITG